MVTYIVDGKQVDPFGNEVGEAEPEKPTGPFVSLSPSVQKALEAAGITTVAGAQALKKEGLVALEGIGEASADKIMALEAAEQA